MNAMPSARYALPAIWLHWPVVSLTLCAFPLGVYMHELSLSPQKLQIYSYHKWLGITSLLLFLPRLQVRLWRAPPADLPAPAWRHRIARLTHVLLYVLLIAVPLSGWLMSSAKGFPVVYLGLLPLPDLVAKDHDPGELLTLVHKSLNLGLLALVALHVTAACKHHLLDHDATLRRMSPFGKQPEAAS